MNGFVRVAAATPRLYLADVAANEKEIIKLIDEAKRQGVSLIVFPELALCGYTVGDLVLQSALLDACESAIVRIARYADGITAVVGMPVCAYGKLYNAATVLSSGKVIAAPLKANIPSREARYFVSGENTDRITIAGESIPAGGKLVFKEKHDPLFTFGVEIGEDMYAAHSPSEELALGGAAIVCNPSAQAETVGRAELRRTLVKAHSAKLKAGYIYAGSGMGESTTDSVYAGQRMIAENGEIVNESPLFNEGLTVTEIDLEKLEFVRRGTSSFSYSGEGIRYIDFVSSVFSDGLTREIDPTPFIPKDDGETAELILSIQAAGLKKRMQSAHAEKLVVGISGGLDSALALLVAVRAAKKPSDVTAITMPCFGTGSRTLNNARALSKALKADFKEIPIADTVKLHFKDIGHDLNTPDTTFENAQARERTQVLMDIANTLNALVVGTGDMSELALGWATYNGDHMSSYGVNASVPKTLVKHLVFHCAKTFGGETGRILSDIAGTAISPELLPPKEGEITQKTENILGKYVYHDFFIYHILNFGASPKKVMYLALRAFGEDKKAEIKAAMKLFYSRFFSQQFKRSCVPDGAAVGISLSPREGLKMPSDALAALWLAEAEKL